MKLTVVQSLCATAKRDTSSTVSIHIAPSTTLLSPRLTRTCQVRVAALTGLSTFIRVCSGDDGLSLLFRITDALWLGRLQSKRKQKSNNFLNFYVKFTPGRIFFCKGSSGHNGPSGPKANSLVEIILNTVADGIRPDAAVPMRSKVLFELISLRL